MSDSLPTAPLGVQSRRHFLVSATGLLATIACAPREQDGGNTQRTDVGADDAVGTGDPWTLFIGTYTKSGTSRGIYQVTVEPHTLAFGEPTLAAACAWLVSPSYASDEKRGLLRGGHRTLE